MEVHMGGGLQVPSFYQSVPECTSVPERTKVYQRIQERTRMYQTIPECAKVYQSMTEYTGVYQSVPEFTSGHNLANFEAITSGFCMVIDINNTYGIYFHAKSYVNAYTA